MTELEPRIQSLVKEVELVPEIVRELLSRKSIYTASSKILDFVYIERKYHHPGDKKSGVQTPARVLVATEAGLILAEEGFFEIIPNYFGYKLKVLAYHNITSVELDISLLSGVLRISTYHGKDADTVIAFDTAHLYQEFERLLDHLHRKITTR